MKGADNYFTVPQNVKDLSQSMLTSARECQWTSRYKQLPMAGLDYISCSQSGTLSLHHNTLVNKYPQCSVPLNDSNTGETCTHMPSNQAYKA